MQIEELLEKKHQTTGNKAELLTEQGIIFDAAQEYELAVSAYDKAIEIKPDYHEAWYNRGIALGKLGRLEEAIASHDKAVEIKPDKDEAFYNKACCYALQNNIEQAIENLQTAINLNPEEYREMAKKDSDFNAIRNNKRFQKLIHNP